MRLGLGVQLQPWLGKISLPSVMRPFKFNSLVCLLFAKDISATPDPSIESSINGDFLKEQAEEMPVLNLLAYDPAQMMVCDDILSPDDIYTGLAAVMVRVEDALRSYALANPSGNLQKTFGLHTKPVTVKSLYGKLERRPISEQKRHPVVARYIDTMAQCSEKVIAYAEGGFYDHRLVMKMVRVSMKMLANKLACKEIAFDIAKNRFGWPSKFGSRPAIPDPSTETAGFGMGAVEGVGATVKDPNDPGMVPYTRWSGKFMQPTPYKWPWNGWPWMANNDPAEISERDRGTQGSMTNYKIPNAK